MKDDPEVNNDAEVNNDSVIEKEENEKRRGHGRKIQGHYSLRQHTVQG